MKQLSKNLLMFVLGAFLVVAPKAFAETVDADVEAEEVMNDGEAAQEAVRMAQDELKAEKRETRELEQTARNAKVTAMIRKKDANRQLIRTDDEYKSIQSRKSLLSKEMTKATKEMTDMEHQLEVKKAQLEKAKSQLEGAKDMAKENTEKLNDVRKKNRRADDEISKIKREMEDVKQEYAKNQKDLSLEMVKLTHTLKIAQAEKAQLDAQTKRLKDEYSRSKARNAKVEGHLAKLKQATEISRENAKWAKEQTTKRRALAGRKISRR